MLNSGGSGEDDVEVGLFRGPELPGVSVESEQASTVTASSSGFIVMEMANRELSKVISVLAKLTWAQQDSRSLFFCKFLTLTFLTTTATVTSPARRRTPARLKESASIQVGPGKDTCKGLLRSDSRSCLCSASTPYWQQNVAPGASLSPPVTLKVTLSWSADACRNWTTCPPRYSVKFAPGKPTGATQAMWMGSSWLLGCGGTSRMDGAGIAKEPAAKSRTVQGISPSEFGQGNLAEASEAHGLPPTPTAIKFF